MNARANKVISVILSIIMVMSIVAGTVWALSDLFKVGMSIQVKYDQPVNAKVYLSTDSSGAGTLRQPSSDYGVNVGNFRKENAALVLNTYDTDTNGGKVKSTFENLGKNDKSLICDPSGEMQFYVYVENYDSELKLKYSANIEFIGSGENAVFEPLVSLEPRIAENAGGG